MTIFDPAAMGAEPADNLSLSPLAKKARLMHQYDLPPWRFFCWLHGGVREVSGWAKPLLEKTTPHIHKNNSGAVVNQEKRRSFPDSFLV
jgi:hypothetical protein